MEIAWEMLAVFSPIVTATNRVPRTPLLIMHRREDSECHSVDSQEVCAIRAELVEDCRSNPAPKIVTEADPVEALLPEWAELIIDPSTEKAAVKLKSCCPAVIVARRVLCT